MDSLPDVTQLVAAARVPGHADLYRPLPQWGLERLPDLVHDAFSGTGQIALGRAESLIVLAVDAIGADDVLDLSPTRSAALTSTFPSTSVVAWRTALTGKTPAQHGVPGVVYRDSELDLMYHSFRDRYLRSGQDWLAAPTADKVTRFPPSQTVFESLAQRGVRSIALPGELVHWPSRWQRDLIAGAELGPSLVKADHGDNSKPYGPEALARTCVDEVDAALRQRRNGAPLHVWAWVNLDDVMHAHGLTDDVRKCLRILNEAAQRWADGGHTVVMHSDHGMTPCSEDPVLEQSWEDLNARLCRLPPGGAGRVRWCYPLQAHRSELLGRMRDLFGDAAIVDLPENLAALGLLDPRDPSVGGRLGEVVILARSSRFMSTMDARFEHGGASRAEMIVPLIWWQP